MLSRLVLNRLVISRIVFNRLIIIIELRRATEAPRKPYVRGAHFQGRKERKRSATCNKTPRLARLRWATRRDAATRMQTSSYRGMQPGAAQPHEPFLPRLPAPSSSPPSASSASPPVARLLWSSSSVSSCSAEPATPGPVLVCGRGAAVERVVRAGRLCSGCDVLFRGDRARSHALLGTSSGQWPRVRKWVSVGLVAISWVPPRSIQERLRAGTERVKVLADVRACWSRVREVYLACFSWLRTPRSVLIYRREDEVGSKRLESLAVCVLTLLLHVNSESRHGGTLHTAT